MHEFEEVLEELAWKKEKAQQFYSKSSCSEKKRKKSEVS